MTAPRILIVEDDPDIALALRMDLTNEDYVIDVVRDGAEAALRAHDPSWDLILLDVMLPSSDGLEICRGLRLKHIRTPVLMLTAKAQEADKILGLDSGADDYVTKPFQVKEITARLRALRRRAGAAPAPDDAGPREVVLDRNPAAPLVLREERGTVHRGDEQLPLTVTEFRLLCELAATPGRVLSRQDLLERVWQHGFFGDERIVDGHVRRLRTKVELDPGAPRLVVTVRGLGYRLDTQ